MRFAVVQHKRECTHTHIAQRTYIVYNLRRNIIVCVACSPSEPSATTKFDVSVRWRFSPRRIRKRRNDKCDYLPVAIQQSVVVIVGRRPIQKINDWKRLRCVRVNISKRFDQNQIFDVFVIVIIFFIERLSVSFRSGALYSTK